ncbi:MAG: STAS domain-containing protein [Planctomycetes bacterium]|nr:STAS domain-containing protein [Planctomycetota bacterium]
MRRTDPVTAAFTRRSRFAEITCGDGIMTAAIAGPNVTERHVAIAARELAGAFDAAGPRLRRFVLDLSDVQFLSSLGVGLCIDARNRARGLGARCYLYGVQPTLDAQFRLLKLDRLYRRVRSETDLARTLAA